MARRLLALGCAALALLMLSAALDTADARRRGHGFHGGRHHFHARPRFRSFRHHRPRFRGFRHRPRYRHRSHRRHYGHHKHHKHHRRHRRTRRHIFLGAPFLYGGYYYYDAEECERLRRKALNTGKRYWWNRYYDCLYEN